MLWTSDLSHSPPDSNGSYLLLVLCDGAEVGFHLSDPSLQRHDLVDDDVGVLDLLQLAGREDGQLPRRLVLDGMQRQLAGLGEAQAKPKTASQPPETFFKRRLSPLAGGPPHLLLPVLDLVVVLDDGGVDLLDAEADAEGLLLQGVLLLLQGLDLLHHALVLLLDLREGSLPRRGAEQGHKV